VLGTALSGDDEIAKLHPSPHVLHRLADYLQLGFHFDDGLGDGRVVSLGADGVELAEKLLTEEIQRAARRFRSVEVFAEFREVGIQPGDFLAEIAASLGSQQSNIFSDSHPPADAAARAGFP
jgi:hypothetical protein